MSEKNSNTPESTADTNSSANESAVLSTQKQVKGSSSRQIGSIATGDTAAAQAAKDASIKSHVEQKQAKEKTAESETKENRDRNTETEITSNVKEKSMPKSTSHSTPNSTMQTNSMQTKSGGNKSLSLLAILIALGIGAGGYYWGNQQLNTIQGEVAVLSSKLSKVQVESANSAQPAVANVIQDNYKAFMSQLSELQTKQEQALSQTQNEIEKLNAALDLQKAENSELRNQLNKLTFNNKTEPNDWLMSEADFLLTNAQRKLVLDNDIETVISLLQEANQTLQKVSSSQALSIRTAINNDLNQLQNLNEVDQDLIMSQLSLLVSQVDNLKVLALNPSDNANSGVSDSIDDWQNNLEKSASSFLDHFIRVRKKDANRPELLAPNQDIYLKENIRLSLQIALSAVPRQQNEVYKQSLDSVASWVRSYFDTDDSSVQQFLQSVDQLKDQSIYVDAPQQLSSWQAIGMLLNRDHRTLSRLSSSETVTSRIQAAEESSHQQSSEVNSTTSAVQKNDTQMTPAPAEEVIPSTEASTESAQ